MSPQTPSQSDRFADAVHQLGCDDEAKFIAPMKKIAKARPPVDPAKK